MEPLAVGGDGLIEHLADRGTRHDRAADTSRLAGGSEQTEGGHIRSVVATITTPMGTLAPMSASSSPSSPITRLLTIRHGESEWNAIGRWQGQADPPLTDAGMLQAVAAGQALGTFDAIWSSTLQRAANTAAIIAEGLGIGPVQLEPDLMENAFGPWEGLTVPEIEAGWPGFMADNRRPEGAEQPDEVSARGLGALRRIAAQYPGGEVLIITHAGLIRTLRRAVDGSDVRFHNLGGCWFHVHHDGRVVAGDPVQIVDPQAFGDTL